MSTDPTVAIALRSAAAALAGSATPELDAELLLAHALGLSRAALLACGRDPLPEPARSAFDTLVARRAAGEPVAYVTGQSWFYSLNLRVTPAVLIPRPETEGLVEWALAWVKRRRSVAGDSPLTLVDIGTGSGAVALALAANIPVDVAEIHATEISPAALEVARYNAARLGLAEQVTFHCADLLPPAPPGPPAFNLIVANLPYVGLDELGDVAPDVYQWEPYGALFAGADGLAEIRRLLSTLPGRLHPGGAAGVEIGWRQGPAVVALAQAAFPVAGVVLLRDLAGLDRIVTVQT